MNLDIINFLLKNKDEKYKEFNDKIINTNMKIIGVRTPIIKSLAKKLYKENYDFKNYKFNYYEEVLLEGYVISYEKDNNILINKLEKFINKIDNWAICDMVCASSKGLEKDKEPTLSFINKYITCNNVWKVRFCFVVLLNYFIEEKYLDIIFKYCNNDKNNFYYVMMAKAWLISECYIKYPKETLKFFKSTNIDKATYNKAISKICDSYRVNIEDKTLLKKMKKVRKMHILY